MLIQEYGKDSKRPSKRSIKERLIIFLFSCCTILMIGLVCYTTGVIYPMKDSILSVPLKMRRYYLGQRAKVDHIAVHMKHMDFQKIVYKRELAMEKGMLISEEDDYVPAEIEYQDRTYKVKMRLKGDWLDHLEGRKWSYRVKVRGDQALMGMKRFSIQNPEARNYIYGWLLSELMRDQDILAPRFGVVNVTFNGKNYGTYVLEEHFHKILVESNHRREGPILKFNEDTIFADIFATGQADPETTPTGLQTEVASSIEAFQMKSIKENPVLRNQFIKGKDLLQAFREGKLLTHQVFDVDILARYFVLAELTGGLHGSTAWNNIRFYYNPVTSLLEPVAFDHNAGGHLKHSGMTPRNILKYKQSRFYHNIFRDVVFYEAYVKALEYYSDPEFLDSFLEKLGSRLDENIALLYRTNLNTMYDPKLFYQNQEYMRAFLNPVLALQAHVYEGNTDQLTLELGNVQLLPIEILGVEYKGEFISPMDKKVVLPSLEDREYAEYIPVSFSLPNSGIDVSQLRIKYRFVGSKKVHYKETIKPFAHLSKGFIENDFVRKPENISEFEFLSIDETAKKITILKGSWYLTQPLVIPKGYQVFAHSGTILYLNNKAKILSYSPLIWVGTVDDPITVTSSDKSGQGVIVLKANYPSRLEHVIFKDLKFPDDYGWTLTGAVTFYESDSVIHNSQFLGNQAEDGLNIIRSSFRIENSLFYENASDAFDSDFSEGVIVRSTFEQCGNDGVDLSGSYVQIEDSLFKFVGDKGISVGEKSDAQAKNIQIKHARVGLASKDLSRLQIENIDITNTFIGMATYQKKSEFGPSEILAKNISFDGVENSFVVEEGSKVFRDGAAVNNYKQNVLALVTK